MGLYKKWCEATKEKDKRKRYWTYVEKDGGRDEIRDDLAETIRSHYDRLDRIAEDVDRLGYKVACQSAFKFDPVSASNFDPLEQLGLAVALVSSELAGIAETRRARVA